MPQLMLVSIFLILEILLLSLSGSHSCRNWHKQMQRFLTTSFGQSVSNNSGNLRSDWAFLFLAPILHYSKSIYRKSEPGD